MAAKQGRKFLLYTGSFGSATLIACIRTTSMTVNNETVDITNKDSAGFRTLLEGAGTQSMSITADGVFDDVASAETLRGFAFANSIDNYTLVINSDGTTGDTIEASFQVASYDRGGDFADAETFSITLESSGTWAFTADQTLSGI